MPLIFVYGVPAPSGEDWDLRMVAVSLTLILLNCIKLLLFIILSYHCCHIFQLNIILPILIMLTVLLINYNNNNNNNKIIIIIIIIIRTAWLRWRGKLVSMRVSKEWLQK